MLSPMQIIYLHGFASSPGSNKARLFDQAFQARGVRLTIPDLNQGDFTGLTVSRQLKLLDQLTQGSTPGSVLLIGSSLGAYTAALFAEQSPLVAAQVLMAPAFGFLQRWTSRMSPAALDAWRKRGKMMVMHHAYGEERPIGWGLIEDADLHHAYPRATVPTLVFHGRDDESVPASCSQRFAEGQQSVSLNLMESDHSLANVADEIITRSMRFLSPWAPQLGDER